MECHREAFDVAYNGLSFFLTQYPQMNNEQRHQIYALIQFHSLPSNSRNGRRQALQCQVESDGSISISHLTKPQ